MKSKDFSISGYQLMTEKGPEWVVDYPELPGISGGGDSYEEALREAQGNKDFYLEYLKERNLPIPIPSDHVDPSMLSGRMTLRVSKSTHQKALIRAEEEGISLNSLLNEAIVTYLTKGETKIPNGISLPLVDDIEHSPVKNQSRTKSGQKSKPKFEPLLIQEK